MCSSPNPLSAASIQMTPNIDASLFPPPLERGLETCTQIPVDFSDYGYQIQPLYHLAETYYYSFLQCLIIPASEIGGPCSYSGKKHLKTFFRICYNTSSSLSENLCVYKYIIHAVVTHRFMHSYTRVSFPIFFISVQIQA